MRQIQDVVENLAHRFHLPSNSPPILLSLFISGMEGERWEERLDGDRDSITLARAKAAARRRNPSCLSLILSYSSSEWGEEQERAAALNVSALSLNKIRQEE